MAASFSRDPLFEVVLRQLPEQVAAGLRNAGLDDAAILESYPCDSYMELVGAGATGGGTWQYSAIGVTGTTDAGGMDDGGLSLSSQLCLSPLFFLSSLVSLRLPFLPLSLPVSDTHKSRSVIIKLSILSFEETRCALWKLSLNGRVSQVVEEEKFAGSRREGVESSQGKLLECPRGDTW